MSDPASVKAIIEGIEKFDAFTLITHVSPDGDTLGSALAMYLLITGMGKKAEVVCDEPVPRIYSFLPCADRVVLPDDAKGYDCVITCDCADIQRFRKTERLFRTAKHTMLIDHHFTNRGYADVNLIVPDAAAACEIIYDLYRFMDKPIAGDAAVCLYTGIVTDTGNLTYSNTTPKCIRMVADMYENGLNITEINRYIYRTVPYSKTRLQGFVLSNMKLEHDGKIGVATLTVAEMEGFGATNEDCEGIVDKVRDVDSVRVAVFIREGRDGTFKVSLRSKECADVAKIANKYGGGGHPAAAGYTSHDPLSTTIANVLRDAEEELLK
ncbi:MAG: bifunctional oligoribonuclease/PAP phosphatase NrnA [Clostridiales bacterium]|nr:bifunctional oligoribonuclease/PAP phosphatase NrnA [Clostridiales bacterium]